MTLQIGVSGISHCSALADLIHRAFAEYRGRLAPPSGAHDETATTLAAALDKGAGFHVLRQRELVGCIFAEPRTGGMYVGRLAVDPMHRRQGVAQLLLAAAENHALERRAAALTLNVRLVLEGNIRLFEGAGYRIVGQGSHPGFAVPTYHIMRKDLGFPG